MNPVNHATRFINLKVHNSVGVLNRITNLIRKRNYNIDELNLTFDNEGQANILIWFCTKNIDINQIAAQLSKLYDVTYIEIVDDLRRIKKNYFVYASNQDELLHFSQEPATIVTIPDWFVGIFVMDFDLGENFESQLEASGLRYLEKSI